VFDSWRERAADDFIYAVKYSRFATHMKKLKDSEAPLELFVSRAERLRDHLGPILVQLPPRWKRNPERLAEFLSAAPEKHRWAIEFRDPSWLVEEVFRILRHHNAALCIHDMIDHHPWAVTADWCYLRFHGGPGYDQGYTDRQLGSIADRVRTLTNQGTDVFTYFNNDAGGHAFRNALTLRELLGLNRTKVAA
jgi:uncharacterized protein YecE (DUF72 family)